MTDDNEFWRVLAIGALYLDVLCTDVPFDEALYAEQEVVGPSYAFAPGGSVVNFARAVRALGLRPAIAGKTGADRPGELLHSALLDDGITLHAVRDKRVQTNLGINFSNPTGRTVFTAIGTANQSLQADDVGQLIDSALNATDVLYLGGCLKMQSLLPALPEIAVAARRKGVLVAVDHGRAITTVTEEQLAIVRSLCATASLYLPSRDEFIAVWGADDLDNQLRAVADANGGVVALKDAEYGARVCSDGFVFSAPALDVAVQNPVGAGDAFNAGFLRALNDGLSLVEAGAFACATAGLRISTDRFPTVHEVHVALTDAR